MASEHSLHNCSNFYIKEGRSRFQYYAFLYSVQPKEATQAVTIVSVELVLSLFALVGNAISLVVLMRPRFQTDAKSLRLHLLLLSATEVLFTLCFAQWFTFQLLKNVILCSNCALICAAFDLLLMCLSDGFMTTRNWCIVFIAVSRCEAIVRPLTSLGKKVFTRTRIKVLFIIVLACGLAAPIIREFVTQEFTLCRVFGNASDALEHNNWDLDRGHEFIELLIGFGFQRGIPTLLVSLTTLAIVVTVITNTRRQFSLARRATAVRATRTVIVLTVVFILLEGAYFLYVLVDVFGLAKVEAWNHVMETVNRICLILDSCANAGIYIMSSKLFREEFLALMHGRKTWTKRRENCAELTTYNEQLNTNRLHTDARRSII